MKGEYKVVWCGGLDHSIETLGIIRTTYETDRDKGDPTLALPELNGYCECYPQIVLVRLVFFHKIMPWYLTYPLRVI